MSESSNLKANLKKGIQKTAMEIMRSSFTNRKQFLFFLKLFNTYKLAADVRATLLSKGEIMPSFLIAGAASRCTECKNCFDSTLSKQLTADEWGEIFSEARGLGIIVIVLAGGDFLTRHDVIQKACCFADIAFPIFTDGTMMSGSDIEMFDEHRNLIPVFTFSNEEDYQEQLAVMAILSRRKILFGAYVTVTKQNIERVTSEAFIGSLAKCGCKAVLFVDCVAADNSQQLVLDDDDRRFAEERVTVLQDKYSMTFISLVGGKSNPAVSFAADRRFIYVNSHGGTELYPFCDNSDIRLNSTSLREAIKRRLISADRLAEYIAGPQSDVCDSYTQSEKQKAAIT